MIKQLSIFIENKEGRLSEILKVFKDHQLDIRSLTIVETNDYGILRLILSETDRALSNLKNDNIMVTETKVMAIEISDSPGQMYEFVNALGEEKINIEYAYQFLTQKQGQAVIIFKVKEEDNQKAKDILNEKNVGTLLDHKKLLSL